MQLSTECCLLKGILGFIVLTLMCSSLTCGLKSGGTVPVAEVHFLIFGCTMEFCANSGQWYGVYCSREVWDIESYLWSEVWGKLC